MTPECVYKGHLDSNEGLRRLKAEKVRRILSRRLRPSWKRSLIERLPEGLLRAGRLLLPSFVMIGRKAD